MLTYLKQSLRKHLSGDPISDVDRKKILAKIQSNELINWKLKTSYIRDDFEIMYAATLSIPKDHADILYYVSDRLKDDNALVFKAITKKCSLKNASSRLQDNRTIVYTAIQNNPKEICYASSRLQNDPDTLDIALNAGLSLNDLPKQLVSNITLARIVLPGNGLYIQYFNEHIRNDIDIARVALTNTIYAIQHISPNLKNNYNLMFEFVADETFFDIGQDLLANQDFLLEVIYKLKRSLNNSNNNNGWSIKNFIERDINPKVIKLILDTNISKQDWPIIKQALFLHTDIMLNPPLIIKTLLEDQDENLVTLAQYALAKTWTIDETTALPNDLGSDLTI